MVMNRIDQVAKIFSIENGAYHTRVKNIYLTFDNKEFDVEQAKEKFIQYHLQKFSNSQSNPLIQSSSSSTHTSSSHTDDAIRNGNSNGIGSSNRPSTIQTSQISTDGGSSGGQQPTIQTSSSTIDSDESSEGFEELGGTETYLSPTPTIPTIPTTLSPTRSSPPPIRSSERRLSNSSTPKRKNIPSSQFEESPQKKCKPYQYADDIVIMNDFSCETIPKRVPEFSLSIRDLIGCTISSIQGNTRSMTCYNNNQLVFAKLTKTVDGLFAVEESSIRDYKSLGLEKKNLSNGDLYLLPIGTFIIVGDTLIPKMSILDQHNHVLQRVEFVDFSFQKIRSYTTSSVDKNLWYFSSD